MTAKHVSAPLKPGLQAAGDIARADDPSPAKPGAAVQTGAGIQQRTTEQTGTVNYYAIISKTITGLALNNAETRGEVYDHAREVVDQRLIDAGAGMSSRMIAIERIAFDRTIKRIESEQRTLDFKRPPPPLRPDAVELHGTASPDIAPLENASGDLAIAGSPSPPIIATGGAPAIIVAKRPVAMPEVKHLNGGTLRLFALIALLIAGVGGYWVAAGKPNLMGLRNPLRPTAITPSEPSLSANADDIRNAPADVPTREQPVAQPTPSETEVSPAVNGTRLDGDIADGITPAQRETDLASFLLLCRPAMTALGEKACGNLEPRPFGGAADAARKAPEWVSMYGDLADTIPAKRVAKPVFSAATPLTIVAASAGANTPAATDSSARTSSNTAREKFERGVELAKADNLDAAIASFSDAIKLDPKFSDAYLQRGQAMFKNGNAERAVADFTLAIQADPRNAQAFKARGMAMLYKGDDDGAIVDLTKAIQYAEIDANSIPPVEVFYARRSRATLYERKQLYDRELVDLSAMIDGFWKNPALATALKTTYRDQGANALMASIYRLRAALHQKRNSIDSAVGDLSFAIQLDPQRSLQYIIERGRTLEMAGKRDQAIADYKQALELSPANADVKSALARLSGKT